MKHALKHLFQQGGLKLRQLFGSVYPYPAIDIVLQDGQQLHLVGSIHMGTAAMSPLPKLLIERLHQADALIVEADITHHSPKFDPPNNQQSLKDLLTESYWQQMIRRCQETGINLQGIQCYPPWRGALILQAQQAHQLGLRSEYGIDYQLLCLAHSISSPVIELEGSQAQIALLNQLPDNGIILLLDTLEHWHVNARLLQSLVTYWISPSNNTIQVAFPTVFSSTLSHLLITQRNQAWLKKLLALPPGYYVVTVGAMHLYSEGNLPELLHPHRQKKCSSRWQQKT